jgi:peptidoglycan/LPS O-acetylase OafA/YrhL
VLPQIKVLTTLRFFAAFHVVLYHAVMLGMLTGGPYWGRQFAAMGFIGVTCFFVLSGFILVYTYGASPLQLGRFWQARFARIYPAYLLALLLTAPFFFTDPANMPFYEWSRHHLVAGSLLVVTMLQAWVPRAALTWNPVCWSLSVEAFFYLLFPFILPRSKVLTRSQMLLGIVLLSALSLLVSVTFLEWHPDGADNLNTPGFTFFWRNVLSYNPLVRLPEFVIGMLAGHLFVTRRGEERLALPLIIGGLGALAVLTALFGRIPWPLISPGFLAPAFAAMIYGLALQPKWTRFLESRVLVVLGEASYSLYLLHALVLLDVYATLPNLPHLPRLLLSIAATIPVALIVYFLVERPARNWLRPRSPASLPQSVTVAPS